MRLAWLRDLWDRVLLARDRMPYGWRGLIVLGVVGGAALLWSLLGPEPPFAETATAQARVVDVTWRDRLDEGGVRRRDYALTVEFEDERGVRQRSRTAFDGAHYGYRVGDRALVSYDLEDPARVALAPPAWPPLVAGAALVAVAALVFLFLFGPLLARGLASLRERGAAPLR